MILRISRQPRRHITDEPQEGIVAWPALPSSFACRFATFVGSNTTLTSRPLSPQGEENLGREESASTKYLVNQHPALPGKRSTNPLIRRLP